MHVRGGTLNIHFLLQLGWFIQLSYVVTRLICTLFTCCCNCADKEWNSQFSFVMQLVHVRGGTLNYHFLLQLGRFIQLSYVVTRLICTLFTCCCNCADKGQNSQFSFVMQLVHMRGGTFNIHFLFQLGQFIQLSCGD